MKKLLTLLAAGLIIAPASLTAVACGEELPKGKAAQTAQAIRNKIKDTTATIIAGNPLSTGNNITAGAIKTSLRLRNSLTAAETGYLFLADMQLIPGQAVTVPLTITVQSSITIDIQVIMLSSSDEIANKITNTNINVGPSTPNDPTDPDTIEAIRQGLINANPALTQEDVKNITTTPNNPNLINNGTVTIKIAIKTTSGQVVLKDIQVNKEAKGSTIANIMDQGNKLLVIKPDQSPDLTNAGTIKALQDALLEAYPNQLSQADVQYMTPNPNAPSTASTLTPNLIVDVTFSIDIPGDTPTGVVARVLLSPTNQYIASKITNTDLNITTTVGNTKDSTTSAAIIKALGEANPILKNENNGYALTVIYVNHGTALAPASKVSVRLIIDVKYLQPVNLAVDVTWTPDNQGVVDAITTKLVEVPSDTNPDTSRADTQNAMIQAVIKANPPLVASMANRFSFNEPALPILTVNTPQPQLLTIKEDPQTGGAQTIRIQVVLAPTSTYLKNNVINDVNLSVPPGTNPSTANPQTISALKKALKDDNPALTDFNLAKISFSNVTLSIDNMIQVVALVDTGGVSQNITLNVSLLSTNQEIEQKITNRDFDVVGVTDGRTSNLNTALRLRDALKKANPRLTDIDLQAVVFENTTLVFNTKIDIDLKIDNGVNRRIIISNMKVKWVTSNSDIANKITTTNLQLPIGTDPDTTTPGTITALKTALQTANPALTNNDLNYITFAAVTFKVDEETDVIATINTGQGGAVQKTLKVLVLPTNQDINAKIQNSNDLSLTAGTNPSTGNQNTIDLMKAQLKLNNPLLNTYDLSKITFSVVTLQSDQIVTVDYTINAGAGAGTVINKTADIWLYPSNSDIRSKITTTAVSVPAGTNPNTTSAAAITAIRKALKDANATLSNYDIGKITFSQATLQAGTAVTVNATIDVGVGTAVLLPLQVTLLT